MRLRLILVLSVMLLLLSCGSTRNMYFERWTEDPQTTIDSLSKSHHLLTTRPYREWFEVIYYGSDSIPTHVYTSTWVVNDTTWIMSVTDNDDRNESLVRFRKEIAE